MTGVSYPTRRAVVSRDGFVCRLCGESVGPADLEIDHILPKDFLNKPERAGEPGLTPILDALVLVGAHMDSPENLQVAHRWCNRRKKARLIVLDDCRIDDTQIDDAGIDDVDPY